MLYICIFSNKFDLNQTIHVSHSYDQAYVSLKQNLKFFNNIFKAQILGFNFVWYHYRTIGFFFEWNGRQKSNSSQKWSWHVLSQITTDLFWTRKLIITRKLKRVIESFALIKAAERYKSNLWGKLAQEK